MKMFKSLIALSLFCSTFAFAAPTANAQNATVVSSCGLQAYNAGDAKRLTMTTDGKLCTNATGGGGGGTGDASQATQTLQLAQETAINTVLGTTATSTWDGSSAAASMAIQRYQGVKLEAIRALLAGTLTVGSHAVTNAGTFAVQATLAAETTKVIGTVNQGTSPWVISGAVTGTFWQATQPVSLASVPSHAVTNAGTFATQSAVTAASGAIASGALAVGSGTDGWNVSQGAKADSVCGTSTGTCSELALIKYANTQLASIVTNTGAAIPAGSAIIGKTGIDQTTPGTTNLVAITPSQAGVGATGAAPPSNANYMGALSGSTTGGLTTGLIACDSSVVYDASTNGSTELVALSSGKSIYVCGYSIIAGGTVNVKLITGTGTACATGSSNKTPAYQLTAQAGISDGAPFFRGLKTAASNALCINASAGVAAQAIVYYAQF